MKEAGSSDCVDFLVSILVRFPQIFAIKYNNGKGAYVFSFMYRGPLIESLYQDLKRKIRDYYHVYGSLQNGPDLVLSFKKRSFQNATFIDVTINGDQLGVQDINLLASIMTVELGEGIISDYEEYVLNHMDGEMSGLEREIEYLSREGLQDSKKENLILFRESGKVYVFDK